MPTANAETRQACVPLSQYHAGQSIEHVARMLGEGEYFPGRRDAFGRLQKYWKGQRWQATHIVRDLSCAPGNPGRETVTVSPWFETRGEAEDWLKKERGLLLDGPYWDSAQAVILDKASDHR